MHASLDEPQAVELAPNLRGKKVKKIKKKRRDLSSGVESLEMDYGSLTKAPVQHSAL